MKSIKYLMLAVASAFMLSSCSEKNVDVDAPWETVNNNQAQVQILFEAPVVNNTSNYIYKIEMAGMTYVNNGAAMITPYNGAPGGSTGLFYTIPAGEQSLKLYGKNDVVVVDQKFTVEGGKKYQVFIAETDKAPIVIECPAIPHKTTTNTAEYCAVRFYNFMWETAGVRPDYKLQLRIQAYDNETKTYGEYVSVGKPVGFGEATEWLMPDVYKTSYNSAGSQRINLDVMKVMPDGSLEPLTWLNSSANEQAKFTDYWTESIGRGYCWILRGVRNETIAPIAISQWTLR